MIHKETSRWAHEGMSPNLWSQARCSTHQPPKLSEVMQVILRARSASALGPNGIPYRLYKNCPSVVKLLWAPMKVAWTKLKIPSEWQRAVALPIPKQQDFKTLDQFQSIALLNLQGKIFFSVMARRMATYLMDNCYIDTSCQKAGVPSFPGCVEHTSMIWDQIQTGKRERKDLHVVCVTWRMLMGQCHTS